MKLELYQLNTMEVNLGIPKKNEQNTSKVKASLKILQKIILHQDVTLQIMQNQHNFFSRIFSFLLQNVKALIFFRVIYQNLI